MTKCKTCDEVVRFVVMIWITKKLKIYIGNKSILNNIVDLFRYVDIQGLWEDVSAGTSVRDILFWFFGTFNYFFSCI